MKIQKYATLILALLLSSCNLFKEDISSTSQNHTSINSSEEFSSDSSINNIVSSTIDIYAINDFHGRISERQDEKVPGISKLSSYLTSQKEKNPEGYIFLASGDIWQDTYESASNKGALLSECLEAMECETMTLGNHDFDWGKEVIINNQALSPSVTYLSANVYNYPNEDEFANLGKEYKIIERNDLKIGIIGTIGSTQNTSITSSIWDDLTFKETTNIVKNLSNKLRIEEGCQIVIWSNHASFSDSDPYEVTSISPLTNKSYVDAVFNGHSHQNEIKMINQVPFVQSGSHGKSVGHIQLTYNKITQSITTNLYENIGFGQINYFAKDQKIEEIINKYLDDSYKVLKNEIIGTLTSNSSTIDSHYMGSLLAKATYDLYPIEMKDVDIVINNGSRAKGKVGEQTRETIFNMIPFTNYTYICKNISGKDILNELSYSSNYYYLVDENLTIQNDQKYTIACIDYLLLHKNQYRQYNYFPSFNPDNVTSIINEYCYDIVIKYLKENQSIDESLFTSNNYK